MRNHFNPKVVSVDDMKITYFWKINTVPPCTAIMEDNAIINGSSIWIFFLCCIQSINSSLQILLDKLLLLIKWYYAYGIIFLKWVS